MIRPSLVARLFPLLVAALLVACSGGSSGPAPAPASSPTPTPAPTLYSLSGTISAPDLAAMDSDVNDPNADPHIQNNDFDHAQAIPNPAMVGGYVITAEDNGTGQAGDYFATMDDAYDYYRVTLAAGQSVTLSISDYDDSMAKPVDLNLFLYDGNDRTVKASSLGDHSGDEAFTVADSGDYFIAVQAVSGSSNYVMTVGQPHVMAVGEEVLRLEDDFVPGDVLVHFGDKARPAGLVESLETRAATLGLVGRAGAPGRAMRMALPTAGQGGATADYRALGASAASADMRARLDTIRTLKRVRRRADVQCASLNYIRKSFAIPNDLSYPLQWHYPLINLPQAWDVTTDADGTATVAVVDTGVFMAHPDLYNNLLPTGFDFVSDVARANDGDGIDDDPDDPGDAIKPGESTFHGTHVAGTVAALSNNSRGVAGVSWGTKIMPVRVLGVSYGSSYDVMQGVRYAARLANDSGTVPPVKADVINLSLGGGGYSSAEQQAFNAVRSQGVIVVAAAGNSGSSTPNYPAAYAGVVSVSAVDKFKNQASYSNYGSTVDVAAPGGDANGKVYSTWVNDSSGTRQSSYAYMVGTSMATPHVAGVVALMKSIYPGMTPAEFDALLASGLITEDLGEVGRDNNFGYGLIDALKAVQQASILAVGGGIVTPILSVTPNHLDFDLAATQQAVTVSNAGGGTLTMHSQTSSAAWLTVTPVPGSVDDATGLGIYAVTVDRNGLMAGTYTAEITFTSDGGTLHLPVTMVQSSSQAVVYGNAGFQYVLLIDPLTTETLDIQAVANDNGVYTFRFTGVEPGDYFIMAGTDSDNDGLVCEAGEACGGYPTVAQRQKVKVTAANRTHLDFSTGFSSDPLLATPAPAAWPAGQGISRFPGK